MALPTTYKRINNASEGPIANWSEILANSETVYAGRAVGLGADGYLHPWDPRCDYEFVGFCTGLVEGDVDPDWSEGQVTGNTSATPPIKIGVDTSGALHESETVVGVSAQTSIGEPVWIAQDGSYTLTPQSGGVPPQGVVKAWHTSTTADIKWRGWDSDADYKNLHEFNLTHQPSRLHQVETFLRRPALNATLAAGTPNAAEIAATVAANFDFEISGTNAADSDVAFVAGGGCSFTTAGADNDQMLLSPHTDSNQSAWDDITCDPQRAPVVAFTIETGSDVTTALIHCGLKLTNTATVATDNDQLFIRFDTDVSDTTWQVYYSKGGTDYTVIDSGVTVSASTIYYVVFEVGADGVGNVYIGSGTPRVKRVARTVDTDGTTDLTLTAAAALKPFCGVQALATAARAITVRRIERSLDYAA